jgi:hypothetical protein
MDSREDSITRNLWARMSARGICVLNEKDRDRFRNSANENHPVSGGSCGRGAEACQPRGAAPRDVGRSPCQAPDPCVATKALRTWVTSI